MQHNLLINGKLVAGEGEKVPVYNPATGEVILEIAEATAAQVDAAVEAADRAFDAWSQTTPKTRAECLLKLADAISAQAETLAQLESLNCGKPLHCVINDEMPAIADVFRFFAGAARCLPGMAAGEYLEGHTSMIRRDPVGVVAQTTQRRENLEAVVAALREAGLEPIVKNTICSATRQRQEAAADLASAVDAMVVIGGRNSSNTTRLAEVCALTCPRTFHIESADELDPAAFAGCRRVGVTAGASTPENQIAAVEAFLRTL